MRMRHSPEGAKILHMGPRLAMSIMNATRELEKIVMDQQERERVGGGAGGDGDVVMADGTGMSGSSPSMGSLLTGTGGIAMPVLTASWVVVKGEDWEMVDCAA
ncbi:hypothetical protein CVT26_002969 [Gymnopilus dilepis]|uniref:Uncharacterized protein n=1 Tax=Gymnopilus dilepis TaxID=231916 RepID=A0A409VR25_9AGAR|nr:hypothetical protein CVT26_002969 [Gymnopilus dilepis]